MANTAETIFLVGDIFDLWSFRAGPTWREEHSEVIRCLLTRLRQGVRMILIPGNHDLALLTFAELSLPGLEIYREFEMVSEAGERFLVVHGHEQDVVFGRTNRTVRAACAFGERIGVLTRALGVRAPFRIKRHAGRRGSAWSQVARPIDRIGWYERTLAEEARRRGLQGVICGHSHVPADRTIDGVRYINCGDWIHHCTAVAENWHGEMELVHWRQPVDAGELARHHHAPAPSIAEAMQ